MPPPPSSSMAAGIHVNASNMRLPFWEPKLNILRSSEYSEIHGFPSNIAPSNMFDFGFDGSAKPKPSWNLNLKGGR